MDMPEEPSSTVCGRVSPKQKQAIGAMLIFLMCIGFTVGLAFAVIQRPEKPGQLTTQTTTNLTTTSIPTTSTTPRPTTAPTTTTPTTPTTPRNTTAEPTTQSTTQPCINPTQPIITKAPTTTTPTTTTSTTTLQPCKCCSTSTEQLPTTGESDFSVQVAMTQLSNLRTTVGPVNCKNS